MFRFLLPKKNKSYLLDFDSQTEAVYGEDAVNYLNNHQEFEYETQIIFPKKAEGTIETKGRKIQLPENSAVLINPDTKAKVSVNKGYPLLLISKKDYDWYERYGKDAKDGNIRDKFLELIWYNSHLYNGEFTPNVLLDEDLRDEEFLLSKGIKKYETRNGLTDALWEKRDLLSDEDRKRVEFTKNLLDKLHNLGFIETKPDNYVRFKAYHKNETETDILSKAGFSQEEIDRIMPVYSQARQARVDSRYVIKNPARNFRPEIIKRMKEAGFIHNTHPAYDSDIYWREIFGNENDFRRRLWEAGFNKSEEDEIVAAWKKENLAGFDVSGLKYINEDLAVYNLNDKLNNWTHEKTNWVTNSTVLSSSKGNSPFVGVSMVQYDDDGPVLMSELRREEKLHSHPNKEEKRQTEIYIVTSGAAVLNVVKDGKSKTQLLREGDLAVVAPGVSHCVNSVLGEYEHIVTQLPSAFQYGFSFKQPSELPEDYDEEKLQRQARADLEEYRREQNDISSENPPKSDV